MSMDFWYGVITGASAIGWLGIMVLGMAAMTVRKKDGNDK